MYRGRRYLVVSAGGGLASDAPFFRLRATWMITGFVTGLVSYKLLEPAPEGAAVKIETPPSRTANVKNGIGDESFRPRP